MRIGQIPDPHIGYRQYNLEQREADFAEQFLKTCRFLMHDEPVDVAVIVGDLFHSREIQPRVMMQARAGLEILSGHCQVFAVEGNHDRSLHMSDKEDTWVSLLEAEGLLTVLGKDGQPECVGVDVGREKLYIVGFPYLGHKNREALGIAHKMLQKIACPSLLLCHIGVAEVMPSLADGIAAVNFEDFDRVATGHYHKAWDNGKVFCGGTLSPCKIDEGYGGVYIHTLTDGMWQRDTVYYPVTVINSASREFIHVDADSLEAVALQSGLWQGAVVEVTCKGFAPTVEQLTKACVAEPLKIIPRYAVTLGDSSSLNGKVGLDLPAVEREVIRQLAGDEAEFVLALKEMVESGTDADSIAGYILEQVK